MGTPLRVLIIEDALNDIRPLISTLESGGYDPVHQRVETAPAMLKALREASWDIVLCGYRLLELGGLKTISLLGETNPDIPLIVIAGRADEDAVVECLRQGARGYVRSDNLARLAPAIARELAAAEKRKQDKFMEEKLRKSEEQYRLITETTQDLILITDLNFNVLFANKAVRTLMGGLEPVGLSLLDFTPPELSAKQHEMMSRRQQGFADVLSFEWQIVDTAGRLMIMDVQSLLRKENEKPAGVIFIARNITQIKQTEDALQKEKTNQDAIFDASPIGMLVLDAALNIVRMNAAVAALIGEKAAGEKPGRPGDALGCIHSSEDPRGCGYSADCPLCPLRNGVVFALKTQTPLRGVEFSVDLEKDGRVNTVWLRVGAEPLYLDGSRHVIVALDDITEKKDADARLQRSEDRYRSILEDIDEGYFEMDRLGAFTFINDAQARNLAYSQEELTGMNYREICDPETARQMKELYGLTYQTGEPFKNVEATFIAKDGSRRINEFSAGLIRDEEGKPTGFRGVSRDITERKKEEEARRQDAQRYRIVLEDIEECYYELDLGGRFTFVNDAQCRDLGYPREELIGMPYRQYTQESMINKSHDIFASIYKTGQSANYEVEHIHKDGTTHYNEVSASLMRDTQGEPIGFHGVSHNISLRKKMENELRQSEAKYRTIIETIEDGYIEVDLAGNWTFVNDVICGRMQYSREELSAADFRTFHTQASAEKSFHAFVEVFKTGKALKALEIEAVRKDGSIGNYELSVSLMKDAQGQPIGFRCISRDINERKRIEEVLRFSEQRYRSILENMQEGYFENELNGRITFVNDAACKHLGYAKEEMLGLSNRRFQDEAGKKKTFEAYSKLFRSGEPIRLLESEFIRKDGSRGIYELSVDLIRDARGTPTGYRGVSRDITERILAGQEMKKAKEAAEAANSAKSEFLANMSHEIRTPMNGVIGMTELLLDTPLSPEQRQFAEIVRTSSVSLLSLLNDILDLSKIEAQKFDLEKLDFNLRMAVEDIADMVAIGAHDKGLELTALVEPDVPSLLRGDPGRLRQTIVNLTGNAVKFTQTGQIVIRVSRVDQDERTVTLRFAVSDTGIGIPQNRLDAIFSPFIQVDSSTTRKYGGTGLGLTISRQLAELMGGRMGCESEVGIGSTFWFTVVLEKQPADRIMTVETLGNITGAKVLVVDDHVTNRMLVVTLLKEWQCRFAEAENGEDALITLRQALREKDPFQIALLDMMMPGMDGEELGRRIKEDVELGQTRIIMMTSVGVRGDVSRLAGIGFDGFFTKPVRQSHLHDALAMAMGRNTDQASAGSIITRHSITEAHAAFKKILVAEDNPTNQNVALAMLRKLGYSVDLASNGAEAIQALKTTPYDLVLMDCQMPEMDGYEATRLIRLRETGVLNPAIPVIALTAYAMTDDRHKYLEAGMDDYLTKPVQMKNLAETLSRWLTRTNGRGEPVGRPQAIKPAEADRIIFNEEDLLERLMDDTRLAAAIVARFLSDMPGQFDLLKTCLQQGDLAGAKRQAHAIKGASANVGAKSLQSAAEKMEEAGESKALPEAAVLFLRLEEELLQFKAALTKSTRVKLTN